MKMASRTAEYDVSKMKPRRNPYASKFNKPVTMKDIPRYGGSRSASQAPTLRSRLA